MTINSALRGPLNGTLLAVLIAGAAFSMAQMPLLSSVHISPLIAGLLLGMVYANTLAPSLPGSWSSGLAFCSKRLLRLGIILYGFRLTLQNIIAVGWPTLLVDATVVTVTITIAVMVGRLIHLDRTTALLTGVGSAVCGAAAVLGADSAIRARAEQTAVAVATVVLFGTISMFLYPLLYKSGLLDLSPEAMAIYTGSTLHEVAHVVGAGNAMSPEIAANAIIVKMIRVTMLVPLLVILALLCGRSRDASRGTGPRRLQWPWFALGFLLVIAFNSLDLLPKSTEHALNNLDTVLLTVAMTALGMETSFARFRKAGSRAFLLAAILYVWLLGGGYLLASLAGYLL